MIGYVIPIIQIWQIAKPNEQLFQQARDDSRI